VCLKCGETIPAGVLYVKVGRADQPYTVAVHPSCGVPVIGVPQEVRLVSVV
jgi:hypothetical protein